MCASACVAVLYKALRSCSGMSCFTPGLNRPVSSVKSTRIDRFDDKKNLGGTEVLMSVRTMVVRRLCLPWEEMQKWHRSFC